eukprot:CAMPEP_0171474736 /NCGR_PEP_ID=MMETSP0946-20130122/2599_1 /TAXON_ID=109269 /ORGANISM="Vaucheria litorea, Strain CCMP2940" /LENGTH=392 /DNA_ID=CAMNT_0012004717 /DNA_START=24 /DNA_END=1202 /DNA_ORIENTATION=+
MFAKVVLALSLAVFVAAELPAGGENFGIPLANLPIPFDKCSVAGANDAEHRLTVFTWGHNNEYWFAKQAENWGEFGEWKSAGGFFAGGPTVIRNADNDLVVFGRGADRKVWYKVFKEGSDDDSWTPLGGKLLSGRIAAINDPQGLIHIFARGKDSAVWEKRQYANGTEAVWGEWVSLGGIVTSGVEAVMDNEGIIHLFARGVDGALWSMTQKLEADGSLTWVSWVKSENSVFLSSSASIKAKRNAQGLVEVVARGGDKAFWHTRQTVNDERGVVMSPWKSLGGIFSSAPELELNSDSLLTVYGRGPEKGVWYKQQAHHPVDSPSDLWSKWVPLGGRFSAGVNAMSDSRGYINIFGRGLDKSVWTRGQMYSNKTVGFFGPWSNMGGRFRSFPC